jgi:hypothetical protein
MLALTYLLTKLISSILAINPPTARKRIVGALRIIRPNKYIIATNPANKKRSGLCSRLETSRSEKTLLLTSTITKAPTITMKNIEKIIHLNAAIKSFVS